MILQNGIILKKQVIGDAMSELTAIFYTANKINESFAVKVRQQLVKALGGSPIISVSHKKMNFGKNLVVNLPHSHLSIYRQALIGSKLASTRFIALCEDDILYSPEHFKYRPNKGKFAYNVGAWNLQTWGEPVFSQKLGGRINLNGLICERELFIEAMEERFAKWPDESKIELGNWAEPGKYEKNLGVTIRDIDKFYTNPPNIVFSHETALSFQNLGKRKKLGEIRATEIPIWGKASEIIKTYA